MLAVLFSRSGKIVFMFAAAAVTMGMKVAASGMLGSEINVFLSQASEIIGSRRRH